MSDTIHAQSPLWVSEWGTYTEGYADLDFSLNLLKNMIRMAQPGETHVDGSHLFSLYDWGRTGGFEGLIDAEGDRRLSYYAFRMGIRALQGGQDILLSSLNDSNLAAIATQSERGHIDVLVVNDQQVSYPVRLDASPIVSIIGSEPEATLWEFSETTLDAIVAHPHLDHGKVELTMPAQSAFLLRLMPVKGLT